MRVEADWSAGTAPKLGLNATVGKVTDYAEMARIGVVSTPALAIDRQLACSGSLPDVEHVEGLRAAVL